MNLYDHERQEDRAKHKALQHPKEPRRGTEGIATPPTPRGVVWSKMPPKNAGLTSAMADYLADRNLFYSLAYLNSWYPSSSAGDNEPRIVIPAVNFLNFPYWQARAMTPVEKRYQSPKGVPRLDSIVVVWPSANPPSLYLVVTEGPLDALAAAEQGFVSIATMGNTPDDPVLMHIALKAFDYIHTIIMADRDSIDAGYKLAAQLAKRHTSVSVSWPETAKDLAALKPKDRKTVLEYAVKKAQTSKA